MLLTYSNNAIITSFFIIAVNINGSAKVLTFGDWHNRINKKLIVHKDLCLFTVIAGDGGETGVK